LQLFCGKFELLLNEFFFLDNFQNDVCVEGSSVGCKAQKEDKNGKDVDFN